MKKGVAFVLFLLSLTFGFNVLGEPPELPSNAGQGFSELRQAGKLFQVRLEPDKKKFLKLYVAGYKTAELGTKNLTVTATAGKKESQLKVTPKGKYFLIDQNNLSISDLKILIEGNKSKEEFIFQLK